MGAARRTFGVLATALMAATVVVSVAPAAGADPELPNGKSWWRPSYGWVTTHDNPSGSQYDRHVDEFFSWDNWVTLARVDAPRTPSQWGTYEHQLTFRGGTNQEPPWCMGPTGNVYLDLPSGAYYDDFFGGSGGGEYAWGMPTWPLVTIRLYQISYDCDKNYENTNTATNDEYKLQSQIGHCHYANGCDGTNTYADDTVTVIPSRVGDATGGEAYFTGSFVFDGDYSAEGFESDLYPWQTSYATKSRVCSSGALVGSCFARLKASSTTRRPVFKVDYHPADPALATASVYTEFFVKCPGAQNTGRCYAQAEITGHRADGSATNTYMGIAEPVEEGDGVWYLIRWEPDEPFASDTTYWTFKLKGDPGETLDVDMAQSYYDNPS